MQKTILLCPNVGKLTQLVSLRIPWVYHCAIVAMEKTLYLFLPVQPCFTITQPPSPLQVTKEQHHQSCLTSLCYWRATWAVYFMPVYFVHPGVPTLPFVGGERAALSSTNPHKTSKCHSILLCGGAMLQCSNFSMPVRLLYTCYGIFFGYAPVRWFALT